MNISEYVSEVAKKISEVREDLIVEANDNIVKNNGIKFAGISLRKEDSNLSSTIFVNSVYDIGLSIDDAVKKVLDTYEGKDNDNSSNIDINIDIIQDFNLCKDKIIAKVINKEKNTEFINHCPYAQFGDLAIIFQIIVSHTEFGNMTITIRNDLMNNWKISLGKLIEAAYENTNKLMPMEITNIRNMIREMLSNVNGSDIEDLLPPVDINITMHVVTSEKRTNGAYYITDRNALIDISKHIGCNRFYILPSSIHEFIVLPASHVDPDALLTMVKEVNATQVSPEEILADNVYMFDAITEELRMSDGSIIPFLT